MLLSWERLVLLPLCLLLGLAHATCYYPNGDSDPNHSPCNPKANVSVCCSFGFECLSNGFCNDIRYSNYTRVLRGGCTDKDWGEGCGKVCLNTWPQGDELVTYCGSGNYCCNRPDGKDCCTDSSSLTALGAPSVTATAKTISITGQSTAVSATTTSEVTTTSASAGRSTAGNNSDNVVYKSTKNTVAIGVGVGVAVGVLLFLGLFIFFFIMQRKKRQERQHNGVRGLMDRDVRRETINPFANAGVGNDHAGAAASGAGPDVRKSMGDIGGANKRRGEMGEGDIIELPTEKIHELPAERDPREVDGTARRQTKVEQVAAWH